MNISARARKLVPSATLAIGAKARQMQADGIDGAVEVGAATNDRFSSAITLRRWARSRRRRC